MKNGLVYTMGGLTIVALMVATGAVTYVVTRPDPSAQFQGQVPYAPQGQYQQPQYQPQYQPQFAQPQQQYQQPQFPQSQQYQQPQFAQPQAQPSFQQSGPEAGVMAMNPQLKESAGRILQIVSKLEGFTDLSGQTAATASLPPIQIFFDPRCPYCHKLWSGIAGKAPIHWIPVSALAPSDGGIAAAATIIQSEKDRPGSGGKEAMDAAFSKSLTPIAPSEAHKESLQQNFASFALIAKTLPAGVQPGVPMVLIPKADGTYETHVGYSAGDEDVIAAAYGK